MNSIDEFLKDIQPVNQQENEDGYTTAEQDYYYEELITFMQSLPKKTIFDTYKL